MGQDTSIAGKEERTTAPGLAEVAAEERTYGRPSADKAGAAIERLCRAWGETAVAILQRRKESP